MVSVPSRIERPRRCASRRRGGSAALAALTLLATAVVAGGCAASPWREAYQASPALDTVDPSAGGSAPTSSRPAGESSREPRLHVVPWDRMVEVLELDLKVTAAAVASADWTPARAEANRLRILRGLRFNGDHARTQVLGRSAFRRIGRIDPLGADREAILRQARRVGATDVVVAWSDLMPVATDRERPLPIVVEGTTAASTMLVGPGDSGSNRAAEAFERQPGSSTERGLAEQDGAIAFFLRRQPGGTGGGGATGEGEGEGDAAGAERSGRSGGDEDR